RSWTSRLGVIELALDEDESETALAHAERLERATEGSRALDRIAVLALLVRAAIASERVDVAAGAARELDELAAGVRPEPPAATAAYSGGLVAAAEDDLGSARTKLEDAVDLYASPYERAQARLDLARVLMRLDQPTRARSEASLARDAFRELDAL